MGRESQGQSTCLQHLGWGPRNSLGLASVCPLTCKVDTNWMVLTRARALAGGKVRRIESSRWVVSIRISTKTYSTRKSSAEVSMGTGKRKEFRRLCFERQEGQRTWPRPMSLSNLDLWFQAGDKRRGCVCVGGHKSLRSSSSFTRPGAQPVLPPTAFQIPTSGTAAWFPRQPNPKERSTCRAVRPRPSQKQGGHYDGDQHTVLAPSQPCQGPSVLICHTQATVAIVHQEISSQGPCSKVIHTASPIGHVTHHHHFSICEPVGVGNNGMVIRGVRWERDLTLWRYLRAQLFSHYLFQSLG